MRAYLQTVEAEATPTLRFPSVWDGTAKVEPFRLEVRRWDEPLRRRPRGAATAGLAGLDVVFILMMVLLLLVLMMVLLLLGVSLSIAL
ncbi:MAG: hypothetical protein M3N47_07365 [Chloroflexota bacterium]|nr:hypothetical protein [Chloroflexota bacterium]